MRPLLAVLSLSDSFENLWPKFVTAAGGQLRVGPSCAQLGDLSDACGVLVAAAGQELPAIAAVEELRAKGAPGIVVVGVETDYRLVATLLRSGSDNYFALPADLGALHSWVGERVESALEGERARALAASQRERFDFSRMIGRSPCLHAALERAAKVIPHPTATVLITGETGTGKELLARAIHYNGPRAAKPFVEINCTALPENLLEAELFGYEPGAFTDARAAKPGLFEIAAGGTLFLDEIGDLSLALQGKLLRILEDKRVRRLGGVRSIEIEARVIAATHVDLSAAVRDGGFRRDLYHRLHIVPIRLPSLQERGGDILILARHFLERFAAEYGFEGLSLSPEIQRMLLAHPWPGNIRELRNSIERAVLLGDGTLDPQDLFPDDSEVPPSPPPFPFPASMQEIESAAARATLERCDGNKTRTAEVLGISRKYLYDLLAKGER